MSRRARNSNSPRPTTREVVYGLVLLGLAGCGTAAYGMAMHDGPDAVGFMVVGAAASIALLGGLLLVVFGRFED